jgi:broad specificity phosphatase PhoE
MSVLVLIKHSLPEIQEGVPASQWHLSVQGRERAHRLAPQLADYGLVRIFSSQEPKAAETAEILAADSKLPYQSLPNLHEHVRPISTNFSQAAFEADVASLFAQPNVLVFGSETANQAHERFRQAVEGIVEANSGKNIAIVAHGTVISLFVSRACGMEPFALWKSLGLPSCVIIDQETGEVIKVIERI